MSNSYSSLMDRIERVLARHRGNSGSPSRQEVDDLYTDACAMILTLEGERAEIERQLIELVGDDRVEEAGSIAHARDLGGRRQEIDRELAALRPLATHLSTASEWVRDPLSAEAQGLRR